MKNSKKFKELVKPQMFDQNEISNGLVTPFCNSSYVVNSSGMTCGSGYACGFWTSVTSPEEGEDILF